MNSEIFEQVRMCAACPKMCRHVCPTFFAWCSDGPTPHGRSLLIHQDIIGLRNLDSRGIEVLYQCLECSACLTLCVPGIDVAKIVEDMRGRIVKSGEAPVHLERIVQMVRDTHNPYGEEHCNRTIWFEPQKTDKTKIIYFAGCTAAYREQKIATDTVELLALLGYSVTVSADEWCCGSPLMRTGFVEDALDLARHNMEMLNSLEGDIIVVTCPGCYRVLSKDYPAYGVKIDKRVVHISTLLEEHLQELPSGLSDIVTYHDPCHLGRHCEVYDEPRRVIEWVSTSHLVEMERSRDNAMCCGNGAGLRMLYPEHARKIGRERIEQALRTGAKYIVTACPFCKNMLKSQANDDIHVVDLPEFVMLVDGHKGSTD